MTKPSFLFYSQDFLMGTLALPMEDRGKYITLLCYMHANGRLSDECVKRLVGNVSEQLRAKFKTAEDGKWYNERLEKEVKKRERYVKSRRNNGTQGGRPQKAEVINNALLFDDMVNGITTEPTGDKHSIPPLPGDVKNCFMSHGLRAAEAEYETLKFLAHYAATDWKTNRGIPITDWHAAITNWLIQREQFSKYKQPKTLTEQWLA